MKPIKGYILMHRYKDQTHIRRYWIGLVILGALIVGVWVILRMW